MTLDVGMSLNEFRERVIDEGIEAAKLRGSLAGFKACRGKDPVELGALLFEKQTEAHRLQVERADLETYWEAQCTAAEIEWVCNVVSAALANMKQPVIIIPSGNGVLKAAEILGVREEFDG